MLLLSVVDNDSVQTATQSINNYTIHSYTLLSAHGFVIKVTDFHLPWLLTWVTKLLEMLYSTH